jgi:hypothetical protein
MPEGWTARVLCLARCDGTIEIYAPVPRPLRRNDRDLRAADAILQGVQHQERCSIRVLFDGDAEPKVLAAEHLVDLDLAYAVTCHKCQGSNAKRVIVPIYPSRILYRSWLYTAGRERRNRWSWSATCRCSPRLLRSLPAPSGG